jgi:hypothetical protein
MAELSDVAPRFIEVAHRIVWCTVATVDSHGRPRTRMLHPLWQFDGERLTGWVSTGPTPIKRSNLDHSPYVSCTYWDASHDVATADCRVTWHFDDETRATVWERFATAPAPVGYDPAIVPGWDSPTSDNYAVLELTPWHVRVFPGSMLLEQRGEILDWRDR